MLKMRKTILFWGTLFLLCTSHAMATTYYVKPTGNDSAAGTSDATAWKTVAKVNSFSFAPGDDVYFLAGGTWSPAPYQNLDIDWSGTDTNRVVIGSYYMSGGVAKIGVPTGTQKPTIVGGYPLINEAGAIPLSPWGSLLAVSANYVTVQNLRIYKSSAGAISVGKNMQYATIENNIVNVAAGFGILFREGSHNNIMRGNDVSYAASGWYDTTTKWRTTVSSTWPVCTGAVSSYNNVFENNYVHECYGEGIDLFAVGANNNIVRDNLLVWVRAIPIYVDNGQKNLIERNVVIGNGGVGGPFAREANGYSASAFALAVEDDPVNASATGNIFRNNLVAGTGYCFYLAMAPLARAAGYKLGGEFIGNTCVGTYYSVVSWPDDANIEAVRIADNIFYDAETGAGSCGSPTTSKITFQNNLWGIAQSDVDCRGSNDVIANPLLAGTSDWRTGGPTNIFDAVDWTPGGPVVGKGVALSNLLLDYFGTTRPNSPSIGGIEMRGATVATPSGLKLSITP